MDELEAQEVPEHGADAPRDSRCDSLSFILDFLLCFCCAVFWRSVPLHFGKYSSIMATLVQKAITEAECLLNVKVVSIVADNENANRGMFKQLEQWRKHLVHGRFWGEFLFFCNQVFF